MIASPELSIFLRLVLAHLVSDFILQPSSWVADRQTRKYRSEKLYLHVIITTLLAWLFSGLWNQFWLPLVIMLSHFFIDLWKSYRPQRLRYFIIDQALHIFVLVVIWLELFALWDDLACQAVNIYNDNRVLIVLCGYLTVTWPLGIIIGIATDRWRREPGVNTDGLAKAGMWIGFLERFLIFTFILMNQYTAIGFLIAAKSVLRFNDKESGTQKKTEYVLIGTLMSFSASLALGIALKYLIDIIG